jgi:hypothetical protein
MTEKALSYALPIAIELTGIFILILGIAVEITTGRDIGHILISAGSTIIAVGSLIWAKLIRKYRETPKADS